ncbi:MAG: Holliday junction resolvase RuvX [Actinobacteria bacterium]|nr:Holliday junction resolvase RuvX [Actinomycetota bacterium]
MRVVGIDLGSRRIGVAVSDSSGTLASPYTVIQRGAHHGADHDAIAAVVSETAAERVVVGLPLALNGRVETAARLVLDEVDELSEALPVPVECHDERLTTVSAERSLRSAGRGGVARRRVIDQVAAAVLLQSWLDREGRSRRGAP